MIQTAGLAFGGTGLCAYRVRGVDVSCVEHLTVESYTVIICQQSYLLLLVFDHPLTHSFIPGLKPSFSLLQILPTAAFPFLLQDLLRVFPILCTVTSQHIRYYFLVFLFQCVYTF